VPFPQALAKQLSRRDGMEGGERGEFVKGGGVEDGGTGKGKPGEYKSNYGIS